MKLKSQNWLAIWLARLAIWIAVFCYPVQEIPHNSIDILNYLL